MMWLFTFYWTVLPVTAIILLLRWFDIWKTEREFKNFERDLSFQKEEDVA